MTHHNDISEKNKVRNNIVATLEEMSDLKTMSKDFDGYHSLLDTAVRRVPKKQETIRLIAPIDRTIAEHILLVHKAQDILAKYLKMKTFILDVYSVQIAKNIGLKDIESQNKLRDDIKKEMEENLQNLTNLSTRIASEKSSALDKGLAYNELKSLTQDLSHRIHTYNPHYQSYLTDNDCQCEILYVMN
jgi:Tfp pilus assembly protein PilO